MDLIDFCKFPPEKITADNIFNYTNLDFSSSLWPIAGFKFYEDPRIIKYICDNITDIHAIPKNSDCCLISKILYIFRTNNKVNLEYVINSGYYLHKCTPLSSSFIRDKLLLSTYKNKYMERQQYIKEVVIDDQNYYPKNIIKYNYILVLLLWIMKYQNVISNVLIKHKIIPFVYT